MRATTLLAGCVLLTGVLEPGTRQPATAQTPPRQLAAPAEIPPTASAGEPLSPRNANYSIDVRLNEREHILDGREVLTWRNIASISASELRFHLYYNAWKNTRSTWLRERLLTSPPGAADRWREEDWGWIDVTAVRLLGAGDAPPIDLTSRARYISPDDGNPDDQTVMAVPLPREVRPGETVNIELEWTSKIPRTFSRTGAIGNYFFIAQWFPKIGVLEDTGWNCHQFHAATEFYADYGIYDVRITLPTGWVLGATGQLANVRDNRDGTTTHRHYQEDVHDFAWTTSPSFLERVDLFQDSSLPPVTMRLLLQPEHAGQVERHFEATRAALRAYGEWYGPYPYGHITVVDPAWQSGSGGMEYPTLFTAGSRWLAPADVMQPEGVTIHEAGHQFWYGIVGNNEFEHAWLDEGLNTFSTARAIDESYPVRYASERFFGGFLPYVYRDLPLSRAVDDNRLGRYRAWAETDVQATPTFRYWPNRGSASAISYSKTALWLHTLERYLGWDTLQTILATFFERWKFAHPKPDDFFSVASEVSGQDLTWFFDEVHRSADVFDYGIQELSSRPVPERGFFDGNGGMTHVDSSDTDDRPFETTVVVRRYGEAIFPVDILVVFEDGHEVQERWDGRGRWRRLTYVHSARGNRAIVDPDRVLLLDVNYTNNSRSRTPQGSRAATKWTLRWLTWLQDLFMTYAFFV